MIEVLSNWFLARASAQWRKNSASVSKFKNQNENEWKLSLSQKHRRNTDDCYPGRGSRCKSDRSWWLMEESNISGHSYVKGSWKGSTTLDSRIFLRISYSNVCVRKAANGTTEITLFLIVITQVLLKRFVHRNDHWDFYAPDSSLNPGLICVDSFDLI